MYQEPLPAPLQPKGPHTSFEAIGFARYLASVHIVMGHMYQAGHLSSLGGFSKFGFTWVPWFFSLSGFILTVAEDRKGAADQTKDPLAYLLRRLETIYPAYFVGLLLSIITVWAVKSESSLPAAVDTLVFVFLLQGWMPSLVESGFVYLTQCWFLSCAVFYWILFYRIHAFVGSLQQSQLLCLAACASLLLPFLYHISSVGQAEWYNEHSYLRSSQGVDIAVLVLKYHPFSYIHIFVLGCCLPRIKAILQNQQFFPYIAPYLTSFSYLILLILFCSGGDDIPGYKLGLRLGIVSCLQCSLLLGLSCKDDLLARVFSTPALSRLGGISYPQYVAQFLVFAWYYSLTKNPLADIRYFLLLFTSAVVIGAVVAPLSNRINLLRIFVFAFFFLVGYAIFQPLDVSNAKRYTQIPYFQTTNWWNDSSMLFTIEGNY